MLRLERHTRGCARRRARPHLPATPRVALLALALAAAIPAASEDATRPDFEIQPVGAGVYAVVRTYPPGLMCDGNSAFIVNDDDVVVVDAPEASREMLAALRKLTRKPVRYVINTHWHDDHITGNHVYREAFPGVEFIGHPAMRDYLPGPGAANRAQMIEGAPRYADDLRDMIRQGQSPAGGAITAEERTAFESDFRLLDRYLAEVPNAPAILPTVTVADRLTLHRGGRRIDVLHLGKGHTAADLVVHLPDEGIVIAGDLLVWPVPLVGGDQSHVGEWAATLDRLRALGAGTIVPGHGPVFRDHAYLDQVAELMRAVKRQTEAAVAQGRSLDETRKAVHLDSLEIRFAGDSKLRKYLFQSYVTGPAVTSAYRGAGGRP
jgi:glyoxylase-like metal-dependent hydrolase (beta-lactamase superfamily II)